MTEHINVNWQGLAALPPRTRYQQLTETIAYANGTLQQELALARSYALHDWMEQEYGGAHGAAAAVARELGVTSSRINHLLKPAREDIAARARAALARPAMEALREGHPVPAEVAARLRADSDQRAAEADREHAEDLAAHPNARTRITIDTMDLVRDYAAGVVEDAERGDWDGARALLAAIESAVKVVRDTLDGTVPEELRREADAILNGKDSDDE